MTDDTGTRVFSQTQPDGQTGAVVEAVTIARGTVLAGRYVIEGTLGRGGMGVVVRARDTILDEDVAIKILRPEYASDPRWIDRLAREVKLARQIRHPNVCRVFDFEQADGHAFLVMELATAGTVRREIDSGELASRPLASRLADARAIAAGLSAIHEAGIVHRDVTPQNVLRLGDGRLVVSDFGLALEADHGTTSIQGGTVAYMAPEVVAGAPATLASDVWSLGVVMHEVVFGVRPRCATPNDGSAQEADGTNGNARAMRQVSVRCAANQPKRRPASATHVVRLLAVTVVKPMWPRALALIGAAAVLAATAVGLARRAVGPSMASRQPQPAQPENWAQSARVVATFPGRISCMQVLAPRGVARVVWGSPRTAEDVSLADGSRRPASVAPETFAYGCPQQSPDGRNLIYENYTAEGHAAIFLSHHADGSGGTAVARSGEPRLASEPQWLPDGRHFPFEKDARTVAVFGVDSGQAEALTDFTTAPYEGFAKAVSPTGGTLVVTYVMWPAATEVVTVQWPSLNLMNRMRLDEHLHDIAVVGGRLVATKLSLPDRHELVWLDLTSGSIVRRASVPGQRIRHQSAFGAALAFVSFAVRDVVRVSQPDGTTATITADGEIGSASAGPDGVILVASRANNRSTIARLNPDGTVRPSLTRGPLDILPALLPGGREFLYVRVQDGPGIYRCALEGEPCRRVTPEVPLTLDVSPDGRRAAFNTNSATGTSLRWVELSTGHTRHVADLDRAACPSTWAHDRTLWVSRRTAGRPTWVVLEADTGRPTGENRRGGEACLFTDHDPGAPSRRTAWVESRYVSELRVHDTRVEKAPGDIPSRAGGPPSQ